MEAFFPGLHRLDALLRADNVALNMGYVGVESET